MRSRERRCPTSRGRSASARNGLAPSGPFLPVTSSEARHFFRREKSIAEHAPSIAILFNVLAVLFFFHSSLILGCGRRTKSPDEEAAAPAMERFGSLAAGQAR